MSGFCADEDLSWASDDELRQFIADGLHDGDTPELVDAYRSELKNRIRGAWMDITP